MLVQPWDNQSSWCCWGRTGPTPYEGATGSRLQGHQQLVCSEGFETTQLQALGVLQPSLSKIFFSISVHLKGGENLTAAFCACPSHCSTSVVLWWPILWAPVGETQPSSPHPFKLSLCYLWSWWHIVKSHELFPQSSQCTFAQLPYPPHHSRPFPMLRSHSQVPTLLLHSLRVPCIVPPPPDTQMPLNSSSLRSNSE